MTSREKGERAETLVRLFYRGRLHRTERELDLEGVDFVEPEREGRWGEYRYQVKWDEGIETYKNVCVEFFEKSFGDQPWRVSPHNTDEYIYLCESYHINIPADAMAALVASKPLTPKCVHGNLRPTTMAIFIWLPDVLAHSGVTFRKRR